MVDHRFTDRQSRIVEILAGQTRPVSVPEIAKQLDCSERTVHRDIDALQQKSVKIVAVNGRNGGLLLERPIELGRSTGQGLRNDSRIAAIARSGETKYVGREAEASQIDRILGDVIDGQGRIVMLFGEPGIGKTRFTREFAARASSRGTITVWGRCRDIEGAPPYWPWLQIIRALFEARGVDSKIALPPENVEVITTAVPELAYLFTHVKSEKVEPREISQFSLYDSFSRLLKIAAADNPLLVVLDDLHWADQASLGLLEFLAGEIETTQIMIVGTSRTIDPIVAGRLASSLSDLARTSVFRRVNLGGLSRQQVAQLVDAESDGNAAVAVIDKIFSATEGNPFFTIEISRLYESTVATGQDDPVLRMFPDAVKDVIERRLNNLSEVCRNALAVGSVLGYQFDYEKLDTVLEFDPGRSTLDLLDEALEVRVLREVSGSRLTYEFEHALIHRFLYDTMPAGRRVQTHARIAQELEHSYGAAASAHAADLAIHYSEARDLLGIENVVKYSTLAGRQAMVAFADAEAVEQFEIAIAAKSNTEDAELADLYFDLGKAHNFGAFSDETVEALSRAFDIYLAVGQPAKAVEVASVGIARNLGRGSTIQASMCKRALAFVELDSMDEARVLIEYGAALRGDKSPDRCIAVLARAAEISRRNEALYLEARAYANMASEYNRTAQYENALNKAFEVQRITPKIENSISLAEIGHRNAYFALWSLGDFSAAKEQIDLLIEHDMTLPRYGFIQIEHYASSLLALAEGEWDEASHIAKRRLIDTPTAPEIGVDAHIAFMRGTDDSVISELTRLLEGAPDNDLSVIGIFALMLAVAGLVMDSPEAVNLAHAKVDSIPTDPYNYAPHVMEHGVRAVQAIARGDSETAIDLYPNFLSLRNVWTPDGRFMGPDRLLALLARTAKEPEKAITHFDESIVFCKKVGLRPELAWTYHDYVEFLLSRDGRVDRSQALQMLDDGLAIAGSLEMAPLEQRLRGLSDEIRAASEVPVYPDGLTRREIEVLRLVATGSSNREIAGELVITENTVTSHVANILAKTASSNRVEATNYAILHGLLKSQATGSDK